MPDWLTSPDSGFWLWVDRFSILLSYAVVATIAVALYQFWHVRRQRRRIAALAGRTDRPRALAVSFGGANIAEPVRAFLAGAFPNREIPVTECHVPGEVTPNNVHRHLELLRQLKAEMQGEGVTELHLFVFGPVALAVALGAVFDNWVGVKVYQHSRDGAYVPWFTLGQAKAAPTTEALAERIHDALAPTPEPEAAPVPATPPPQP